MRPDGNLPFNLKHITIFGLVNIFVLYTIPYVFKFLNHVGRVTRVCEIEHMILLRLCPRQFKTFIMMTSNEADNEVKVESMIPTISLKRLINGWVFNDI